MGKHKHDHKKSHKDRKAQSTTSESEVSEEEVSELSSGSESSTYSGMLVLTLLQGRFLCREEAIQEEEQVFQR